MDRAQLADFLRTRREALQPEDVGLPRGPRRRTGGLRREEVAALCGMSTDYYARIEQQRGPQPSEAMLGAIARGLRLSLAERDHLFRTAGHQAPPRAAENHVGPGTMRILDRLADTPVQVVTPLGETLAQSRPAAALFGDETAYEGLARSLIHRWFTVPLARRIHPPEDHREHSRLYASLLRDAVSRHGPGGRPAAVLDDLLRRSGEFRELWSAHEVGVERPETKRIAHPELGVIEVQCQTLLDADNGQALLVYTATPGTESHEKLRLLTVMDDRPAHV